MHATRAFIMTTSLCLSGASAAIADDQSMATHPTAADTAMPNGHHMMMTPPPPIGVGGGRVVKPGQVMLNYRYMRLLKNQLGDGDNTLSTTKVATLRNHNAGNPGQPDVYRNAPENMTMQAHMFGAQVGITDDLSAMIGVPYIIKERKAVTFAGPVGTTKLAEFENETSGVGDVAVSGLYKVYGDETHHLHMMAGLSFPTGSIREKGKVIQPNGETVKRRLAYGLQLGSGTYDLLPGITYWGAEGRWNWGVQAQGRVHLGDNDEGYTLGDQVSATAWGGFSLGLGFAASARLIQTYQGDIDGEDDFLTGASPTTDPNNYGGWKTSAAFGLTYRDPDGPLMGISPGIEVSVPLYQDLNGPQLRDAYTVFAGVRKVFTF
jgi:hypothetical protein